MVPPGGGGMLDMGDMPPPMMGEGMEGMEAQAGMMFGGLVPPGGYRGRRERRRCFGG